MTLHLMKASSLATLIAGLALSATLPGFGQTTVNSDPVGFVTVSVPASSDAVLAVPLYRTAAFKGVIQSISGSTLTVAGTSPGWTNNQFVQSLPTQTNTYAVLIATGTKEGLIALVTGNGANTVTIQVDPAEDLSGIKTEDVDGAGQGDHLDVLPYWTPGTMFSTAPAAGTQLLLFGGSIAGVNLASSTVLVYTGSSWLDTGTFQPATDAPLGFGQSLVVRNNSASAQSISLVGSVPMAKFRRILSTLAAGAQQDVRIGYSSPVPEIIGNVGLGLSGGDQLLVFDNSQAGFNKSASQVLVFTGSAWLDTANFQDVTNSFQLQPGNGYVLRKAATGSPQNFVWQDLQSYLQ